MEHFQACDPHTNKQMVRGPSFYYRYLVLQCCWSSLKALWSGTPPRLVTLIQTDEQTKKYSGALPFTIGT